MFYMGILSQQILTLILYAQPINIHPYTLLIH